MRYYDTRDDPNCKGFVDLADVVSVNQVKVVMGGAPKRPDDNVAFEVKVVQLVLNFHFVVSIVLQNVLLEIC